MGRHLMKVLAGIVTYNPEIERLTENIISISNQVSAIYIVDNGSSNINKIEKEFSGKAIVKKNFLNKGIATALNQILEYAKENQYEWFITLDQDSVCAPGIINEYLKYIVLKNAGMLTCNIIDRNFISKKQNNQNEIQEVKECITSGSFNNTNALYAVNGFDEKLFIDGVDFEVCLKLHKHDYKIYKINYDGLLHEVGKGKNENFLGREIVIYNHSVLRNYYISRNHIYLSKKYPDDLPILITLLKEIRSLIYIITFEKERIPKLKARFLGLKDGFCGKVGKTNRLL